jgi:hypothetical protein
MILLSTELYYSLYLATEQTQVMPKIVEAATKLAYITQECSDYVAAMLESLE